MRKVRNLCCSTIVATVALFGASAGAQEKVLRVVPHANLTVLDPFQGTIYISTTHAYMVFDTLFGMDRQGKIQPQMLERYETSADGMAWTFVLRDGLRFHDDAPVTAEDVVASLTRWGKKDLLGRTLFDHVQSVEAVDEKTVRMVMSRPFGMVLDVLAKPFAIVPFIMPKRLASGPLEQPVPEMIGSGPFMFKADEYKPGERVVYLKNPKYVPRKEPASALAGGKVVNVDRVEWVILKDPQTQLNALVTGEVDIIEAPAAEQLETLKANPEIQFTTNEVNGASYTVRFNHLTPPFNNVKVRQAAMLALGQAPIIRTQIPGKEFSRTCVSIYPCGSTYASDKTGGWVSEMPQTAKAKEALAKSGYAGAKVVVLQPTDIASLSKAPLPVAQLLRQAGFAVEVQSLDWGSMASRRRNREVAEKGGWNVFVTSHGGSALLNPVAHPILAMGDKGYYGWASDERIETLQAEFIAAMSEEERKRIAEAIQLRAYEQGILYPVGLGMTPMASRKSAVHGAIESFVPTYWGIRKP